MKDFWAFLFIIISYSFGYFLGWQGQYEKGQIDALTGNIKYELLTQPDSTRTWEEIK